MSCEEKDLNNMTERELGGAYLFHSHKAGEDGITGESISDLENPHVKRMVKVDEAYRQRFQTPINEYLLETIARGIVVATKRGFVERQPGESLVHRFLGRLFR